MDKIREQLKNPWVAGAVGLVIGLFIGLVILGWGLFPVKWVNASPQNLRADLKVDYMRMAVESFSKNPDQALAQSRFKEFGAEANQILSQVTADPQKLSPTDILAFSDVVQGKVQTTPGATQVATQTPTKSSNSSLLLLGVLCVLLLIVGGVAAYLFLFRNRKQTGEATPAQKGQEATNAAPRTAFAEEGQPTPIAQFMTTYMSGDDLYDDSFSIDSPSGDFMGECGVGISDTIGVGDPKKVTAFEVWLFDKNDIQTITKVVMSPHAFADPTIRQRLESKGEAVLAEAGKHVLLETATLQLEARVVEMTFGQGALPENSYFDRLTLELAVWPKAAPQP
jgi:hypothetical protein